MSLGDYLVRVKLKPVPGNESRRGTVKCQSNKCDVCNYSDKRDFFVSTQTDRKYSINYTLNRNSCNVLYLISCRKCGLQYVGSTSTKFILRFNNHKASVRRHERLSEQDQMEDDLLYKHFWSEGHSGMADMNVQLIDRVSGREELRDKERQWAYRLNTLSPYGLNDSDFFYVQSRRCRRN